LELSGVSTQLIEARPELGNAPLDLGQGLSRLTVRAAELRLDLGLEALERLLDPEKVGPETRDIVPQEGAGLRRASGQD
jgi:hypothetical protein